MHSFFFNFDHFFQQVKFPSPFHQISPCFPRFHSSCFVALFFRKNAHYKKLFYLVTLGSFFFSWFVSFNLSIKVPAIYKIPHTMFDSSFNWILSFPFRLNCFAFISFPPFVPLDLVIFLTFSNILSNVCFHLLKLPIQFFNWWCLHSCSTFRTTVFYSIQINHPFGKSIISSSVLLSFERNNPYSFNWSSD